MKALNVIKGFGCGEPPRPGVRFTGTAVRLAMRRGFRVGRRVSIGNVDGCIIGYNIAGYGRYVGADYPLLVATDLGIAKCRLEELRLR